jgi:hypothetical protein
MASAEDRASWDKEVSGRQLDKYVLSAGEHFAFQSADLPKEPSWGCQAV